MNNNICKTIYNKAEPKTYKMAIIVNNAALIIVFNSNHEVAHLHLWLGLEILEGHIEFKE